MEKKLTQRELKRIESDKKIIEATIEVVGDKGYTNANIREIAKVAGITQGLITQRFETKENLLFSAVHYVNTEWRESPAIGDISLEELLRGIISVIKEDYKRNEKIFKFIYVICSSSDIPKGITDKRNEVLHDSGVFEILKKAQNEGYIPDGDVTELYNIFLCNTFQLVRDYNRVGMKMPEDEYFFALIQYRDLIAEEQNDLRSKAFESISQSFFSLIYFNISTGKMRIARTLKEIEEVQKDSANSQDFLYKNCERMVDPKYWKDVKAFLDLSTVIERLGDKKVIAIDCVGVNKRIYRISFIFVTKEKNREIVLGGVQELGIIK